MPYGGDQRWEGRGQGDQSGEMFKVRDLSRNLSPRVSCGRQNLAGEQASGGSGGEKGRLILGGCVVMTQVGKPEQTIGFQSFRMRIFEVRGYCPYYEKSTFHVVRTITPNYMKSGFLTR